jgi:hypothetical protein
MGLVTAFNSSKLMRICCAQTDFHRHKEASNEREKERVLGKEGAGAGARGAEGERKTLHGVIGL